jgi:hypothetical protein
VKFQGDVPAFEAACLEEIPASLEHCDRRGLSPFRTLVAVELEGTYPDSAVVVTYRYKAEYEPTREDAREFPYMGGGTVLQAVRTVQ